MRNALPVSAFGAEVRISEGREECDVTDYKESIGSVAEEHALKETAQ